MSQHRMHREALATAVYEHLRKNPKTPMTAYQLARVLGTPAVSTRLAVEDLHKDGKVWRIDVSTRPPQCVMWQYPLP